MTMKKINGKERYFCDRKRPPDGKICGNEIYESDLLIHAEATPEDTGKHSCQECLREKDKYLKE